MLELLKPNMNAIIFPQVSSEPQLYQTAHIRDFEGDAMDILQKKMFTYDESKSHFKTHLQWGFRGFWKKLQQHKFERGSRAFSEMDGDDIDGASFADRQVDTREASVQERAATNSVIEQMRAAIAALDERDKAIMSAWLDGGGKKAAIAATGKKNHADGHYKRAKQSLKREIEKNPEKYPALQAVAQGELSLGGARKSVRAASPDLD